MTIKEEKKLDTIRDRAQKFLNEHPDFSWEDFAKAELLKAAETARAHDHDHTSNYRQCGNTIATDIERQAQ